MSAISPANCWMTAGDGKNVSNALSRPLLVRSKRSLGKQRLASNRPAAAPVSFAGQPWPFDGSSSSNRAKRPKDPTTWSSVMDGDTASFQPGDGRLVMRDPTNGPSGRPHQATQTGGRGLPLGMICKTVNAESKLVENQGPQGAAAISTQPSNFLQMSSATCFR